MTLPPVDAYNLRGVAGRKYRVGPQCSNPDCRKIAEHAHHIWRRSKTGKGFDWIELEDGTVVGNLTALCPRCHDHVTGRIGGHRNAIRVDDEHVFWWCKVKVDGNAELFYEKVAPLVPQPPTPETLTASPAEPTESGACPTCGQAQPRPRPPVSPGGRRRRRKTWPVKVPVDAEENGADVLDTFTEDLAPLLGIHPDKNGTFTSGRYWVLVPALYYAQINRADFIETVLGEG